MDCTAELYEDRDSMFLQNTNIRQVHTVLNPEDQRRHYVNKLRWPPAEL
jgi:hypothetical protein